MKKKILSFVTMLAVVMSMAGCGLLGNLFNKPGQDETEITLGTQNMYMKTYNFTVLQLDSLCKADELPVDLTEGWIRRSYKDYETNESVVRYMYIKELNDNYEMIYLVTPEGDRYIVSKRQVISE